MNDLLDTYETASGCYSVYVPRRAERFWRAMGYHGAYPELPEEAEKLLGWIATDVCIHLSFWDRVRLLMSGKALVRVRTRTDAEVKEAISGSSFEVLPPYERHA